MKIGEKKHKGQNNNNIINKSYGLMRQILH